MKDANIPGEVSMVQAGAPQGENSQDDMMLPMLNTEVEGSSSDAGVPSASKKQQSCSIPVLTGAAALDDPPSQLSEVCRFCAVFRSCTSDSSWSTSLSHGQRETLVSVCRSRMSRPLSRRPEGNCLDFVYTTGRRPSSWPFLSLSSFWSVSRCASASVHEICDVSALLWPATT